MRKKAVWKKLNVFESQINSIYDINSFRQIIEHEIQRSQRTENSFSFIIFNLVNSETGSIKDFISLLKENVRTIDHVGWVDDERIGVILPYTTEEGARQLSDKIEQKSMKFTFPVLVYHYPDHWYGAHDAELKDCEQSKQTLFQLEKTFEKAPLPLWKRSLDVFGSGLGLLFLSPFFLLFSLYIKAVSPGKVFYISRRVGYRGREFNFYKFRSMHEHNNQGTHKDYAVDFIKGNKRMEKLDENGDPRIIPGGKLLRASCIDELPQLINVFLGDMSLVGPRPCIPYEAEAYRKWHKMRFNCVPGMTGLWQVSGKNKLTFFQMIRLDIKYLENLSLKQDIKILLKTIPAVLSLILDSRKTKEKKQDTFNNIEEKLSFS